MKFRFLEDIATADAAFEAYGKTLEELFENCGLALEEVMVDTTTVNPITNYRFRRNALSRALPITNSNIEDLLFDFLSELVFLKDRDRLLFSKIKVEIKKLRNWELRVELWGEVIDSSRHHLRADVKAVTKHLFKIEKEKEGYKAVVVLDI